MMGSAATDFGIDHLLVLAAVGAPEAELLLDHGFLEGSGNVHPGQGTANRRFFFRNFMLELLWVEDVNEVRAPPADMLHLWPRWRQRTEDASPFGLCLRPKAGRGQELVSPPFAHVWYRPVYSPYPIAIATNADNLVEPLLFALPVRQGPGPASAHGQEPIEHPNGVRELTSISLSVPPRCQRSPALACLQQVFGVHLRTSARPLLEISFRGAGRRHADLRPGLPVVLRW